MNGMSGLPGMPGGMDPKIQVQVDPNEDTEWNDILRAKGIIPEKEKDPTEELEDALSDAIKRQHDNRLEGKDLDELEALEDEENEDFLEIYKQKRISEMQKLAQKSKFGSVYPVTKPEYNHEVSDASKDCFVFVHLTLGSALQSRLLSSLMIQAAYKFQDIKFVEIPGNRAVENYPDKNCPTILIYKDGDVVKQYITLMMLGGNQTNLKDLENLLVEVGAVQNNDKRLLINQEDDDLQESHRLRFQKKSMRSRLDDNDDDNDDFFD